MKTKSRNLIVVFLMALAMSLACIPVATLTANAELDSLKNVSVNNGLIVKRYRSRHTKIYIAMQIKAKYTADGRYLNFSCMSLII